MMEGRPKDKRDSQLRDQPKSDYVTWILCHSRRQY